MRNPIDGTYYLIRNCRKEGFELSFVDEDKAEFMAKVKTFREAWQLVFNKGFPVYAVSSEGRWRKVK